MCCGRLASRCNGWVPLRILPIGMSFPFGFNLRLRGLGKCSTEQGRIAQRGTGDSEMFLRDLAFFPPLLLILIVIDPD